MAVKFVPDGYHSINPYLTVRDAQKAIDWYKTVFDATDIMCLAAPTGQIAHAEIQIGETRIMLRDATERDLDPETLGGTPVMMHLYVEDVDALARKATAEGAEILIPVENQFYGDRSGRLKDPFGHVWVISTHIEDVSSEEMETRMRALMQGQD